MENLSGAKICMATTSHSANDDRIFYKEARSLVKAGANVTVLCSNNMNPPVKTDGVRFENYAGGGSLRRRIHTIGALESAIYSGKYDVVHCHEPDGLIAALRVKGSTRIKVIFDSHEMWGSTLAGRFPRPFWMPVEFAYKIIEGGLLKRCDAAIGASWAITEYLSTIIGEHWVETILNVPVVDVFGENVERTWDEETTFCHDGHLTYDRGLKTMAKAVKMVSTKRKIVFKIVGDVFDSEKKWLEKFIDKSKLQDVIVRTGWLPYERVGAALAPCHIGLIAFRKTPNNIVTSSNKVFNYMLFGMPFIGPLFRLSKQKLVREEQCGLLADSSSVHSYAKAMTELIDNRQMSLEMSRRSLEASRARYRWEHMEGVLFGLYARLLKKGQ